MCGIVAYVGNQRAIEVALSGLQRLEYRGYDSAGIAYVTSNEFKVVKTEGKVADLAKKCQTITDQPSIGIGHTRWATHGEPTNANAHPHLSQNGGFVIVHNGIIENYLTLKKDLEGKGYDFQSETDSEVVAHLLEEIHKVNQGSVTESIQKLSGLIVGAFAIAIIHKREPDTIYALKKGSPMVIGLGDRENFIGSDPSPILEHTKKVIYVEDDQIVRLTATNVELKDFDLQKVDHYVETLNAELSMIEKGGYEHFMLKEIHEQPKTILDSMRGRVDFRNGSIHLGGLTEHAGFLFNAQRIKIVACGTSLHAGLVGKYLFESLCKMATEVEFASEFRYREPVIKSGDAIMAISQSGETADTIVAIQEAEKQGASLFGICNVVGSTISRMTKAGAYTHAGIEIGVASTKAFTAQLTVLYLIALKMAHHRGFMKEGELAKLTQELERIPHLVQKILDNTKTIEAVSKRLAQAKSVLYLGRGEQYPIALEGALKLKEISYIHAEGYPSGEMKHGPLALIDETVPTVILLMKDKHYDKVLSNIKEIKARKGPVVVVTNSTDPVIDDIADEVILIPECHALFTPLLSVIPLQLISYFVGLEKEVNIDKPRNLAKSVTVE